MDAPLPTNVQQFDGDDRISFSKLDNKFIAVLDDGAELEFDEKSKQWAPADESLDAEDALEYGGQSATPDPDSKKRKNGDGNGSEVSSQPSSCLLPPPAAHRGSCPPALQQADGDNLQGPESSKPARPKKKQKAPPQPKQNTAVYVTGLPSDATITEVHDLFSRKAGVIAEEIDSGNPRIKMYADEAGNFKGDALIVFFKPQSVEMAIMLLDDTDFRITASGARDGRIHVQAAESSYKKVQYDQEGDAAGQQGAQQQQGEKRPQKSNQDRQKIIKKTQKLDAKLADWDDDDPYPASSELVSKWDKVVILRHMFTLEELEEDPAALIEIKEDIREECSKLGAVTNVVLYDEEKDGIVSVKFRDVESAAACIKMMHGRAFDGRTVVATLATGEEKFKKSKAEKNHEDSE